MLTLSNPKEKEQTQKDVLESSRKVLEFFVKKGYDPVLIKFCVIEVYQSEKIARQIQKSPYENHLPPRVIFNVKSFKAD